MGEYRTFEDLECWKAARQLRRSVSKLIKSFPAEEKYDLCSQMRRSSRSIGANIAEGYGRYHYQENIQFCRHARGSLTETLDHLIVALDEGYITQEIHQEYRNLIDDCHRLLNGYIAYFQRQKRNES